VPKQRTREEIARIMVASKRYNTDFAQSVPSNKLEEIMRQVFEWL